MNKNIIREDIFHMLESINEQVDNIKQHPDRIPQIELDITMSYIRRLYESFRELNKANQLLPDTDSEAATGHEEEPPAVVLGKGISTIHPEEEVHEEKTAEKKEPLPDDKVAAEPDQTKEEDNKPEMEHTSPVEEATPESKDREPKKKESHQKVTTADLFTETNEVTVAEKFKDDKKSLNEKIALDKEDESIGTKMQHTPINDLKAAIGINEKFLFMNELFSGSIKEYNQAIENLNTLANIEEATGVIDNYKEQYNWDISSGTYTQFFDVIQRRFS